MNIFERTTTWVNSELWIFKLCVFVFGIIAGVWFCDFFKDYLEILIVFAIATGLLSGYWWIKKMLAGK